MSQYCDATECHHVDRRLEGWCFVEAESFIEGCIVRGSSHKVANELLHRQPFFYNDAVVSHLPPFSLIQFAHPRERMCSLCWKCEAYLCASQPEVQHKRCPARRVQVPHPACISSLLAASLHCSGGWQRRHARWFHPAVTSQRATNCSLSYTASELPQQRSRREAFRRWGNPGWGGSPEETRGRMFQQTAAFTEVESNF